RMDEAEVLGVRQQARCGGCGAKAPELHGETRRCGGRTAASGVSQWRPGDEERECPGPFGDLRQLGRPAAFPVGRVRLGAVQRSLLVALEENEDRPATTAKLAARPRRLPR